jgi:hypothetical protein
MPLAALVLVTLLSSRVRSQRLEDGKVSFDEKARPTRNLRLDLFAGKVMADPKDKTHQEAVDIAAKEVVYPLYWETRGVQLPEPRKVNESFDLLDKRLVDMSHFKARLTTAPLQHMFSRQVVERAQEILANASSKPIATINAARMLARIPERVLERGAPQSERNWVEETLPRLVEGNAEYLAGVLLSAIENPKASDGTRYYIYRGMANLLAFPKQTPALLKKETEEKLVHAGIVMVEKKVPFPRQIARGEVEGYKVLRREAVKLVAQARVPSMGEKDRPALTLARVAGNDQNIEPSPRLDERIEACIGLAKMAAVAAKFPDFQPEYAAYQVARAVEALGLEASTNYNKATTIRKRPWKIDAARLGEALEILKADLPKSSYVQQLADKCSQVLRPFEDGGAGDANTLGDWLSTNPAPVNSLFKSGQDSVVKQGVIGEKEKEKEKEKDKAKEKDK